MPGWMWGCVLGSVIVGATVGAIAGHASWGALSTLLLAMLSSQIVLTFRRRRGKGFWGSGRQ
jgi:hypothetical protein